MSKSILLAILTIGFALFFIGIFFSKNLVIGGIIIIAVALFMGLGPDGILRKEQILDTWAILIGNAQGRSEEILNDTEILIKNTKAPSLFMERKPMSPGVVRGLLGTARKFLVVTNNESPRLKPYKVFLNARDYGNNLDVSWYLTYRPSLWQSIASLIPFVSIASQTLNDLDLFDQQDLMAYVTVAHHSVREAVEKMMLSLNQDPSKIERKSKGFLGIS